MKKITLLLSLLIVLFTSCNGKGNKDAEIIILTTNDIHGRIDNFPKLAAYYKKLKAENKHVFLFNAGDIFSGNPLVDQYPEKGYPIIDIMNHVGYQLSNFGNHEFDYGQEMLAARLKQAKFPFILGNAKITDASSPIPPFKGDTIFNIDGIKMGVFALVEVGSGGTPSTHPDRVKGIVFTNPIETAAQFKSLRNKSDVLIALTHIGVETDVELANAMPEIDVILGGHSHTRIDTGMMVNGVLITQTESWLRYLGETRIVVKNGKVVSKTNRLIDMNALSDVDPDVKNVVDEYKAKDPGSVILAKATTDIVGKQALGGLMTDAITEGLGLDIALQNAGGVRTGKISAGDITINDIFTLDPFGNEVVKIKMTGKELKDLIESTIRRTKGSTHPDLLVSGITYQALIKPTGEVIKIDIKDKNGKPLDMKHTYNVGMNSYIYSKYEFNHADPGASLKITASQVLIDYLKQKKTISGYDNVNRITIEVQK